MSGLFFFLLLIFLILWLSGVNVLNRLFGGWGGGRPSHTSPRRNRWHYTDQARQNPNASDGSGQGNRRGKQQADGTKKIFGDDEGEYVDFEEIKKSDPS